MGATYQTQLFPVTTSATVLGEMLKSLAIRAIVTPSLCRRLISVAISRVNLSALFSLWAASKEFPISRPKLFSEYVHHSKFSTLLSLLTLFLWWTTFLPRLFGRKASATKRCPSLSVYFEFLDRRYCTYPFFFMFGLMICGEWPPVLESDTVLTRPSELISYRSKPSIAFQISPSIGDSLGLVLATLSQWGEEAMEKKSGH